MAFLEKHNYCHVVMVRTTTPTYNVTYSASHDYFLTPNAAGATFLTRIVK